MAAAAGNGSHRQNPVFSPMPTPHSHSISIPPPRSTITPTRPFLSDFNQFLTPIRWILTLAGMFLAALAISKRLDKTVAYVVAGLGISSIVVLMLIYPFFEQLTHKNPSSFMWIKLLKAYASFAAIEALCVAVFTLYQLDTWTWSICSGVFILLGLGLYELHDTVFAPRIVTYLRSRGN